MISYELSVDSLYCLLSAYGIYNSKLVRFFKKVRLSFSHSPSLSINCVKNKLHKVTSLTFSLDERIAQVELCLHFMKSENVFDARKYKLFLLLYLAWTVQATELLQVVFNHELQVAQIPILGLDQLGVCVAEKKSNLHFWNIFGRLCQRIKNSIRRLLFLDYSFLLLVINRHQIIFVDVSSNSSINLYVQVEFIFKNRWYYILENWSLIERLTCPIVVDLRSRKHAGIHPIFGFSSFLGRVLTK